MERLVCTGKNVTIVEVWVGVPVSTYLVTWSPSLTESSFFRWSPVMKTENVKGVSL